MFYNGLVLKQEQTCKILESTTETIPGSWGGEEVGKDDSSLFGPKHGRLPGKAKQRRASQAERTAEQHTGEESRT